MGGGFKDLAIAIHKEYEQVGTNIKKGSMLSSLLGCEFWCLF